MLVYTAKYRLKPQIIYFLETAEIQIYKNTKKYANKHYYKKQTLKHSSNLIISNGYCIATTNNESQNVPEINNC